MKYIFIINPKAGEGKGLEAVKAAVLKLPEKNDCEIYETKAPRDAEQFVKNWCGSHVGEAVRFIACGGDGSLNEVINGAVGQENVSITSYPCGSGNDFVKYYGGVEKFMDIEKLIHAKDTKIDLLKCGDRYSDNVTNFGFDTVVAITINEVRAKKGSADKSAYSKGVRTALLKAMKTKCTVKADGEILNPKGKMLLCTLANANYVGGSFKCAPRAKVDDGFIEVCLIKPISRLRFVKILKPYTEGRHLDDPKMKDIIVYRQAKKIEIEAHQPNFAYSLDGEIVYTDHFTVEIAEKAISFAVPD